MTAVVFDAKNQRLVANTAARIHSDSQSMSLRVRRLFYVGKFAAIAVVGVMPNVMFLKNILRAITMGVMTFENTGKFQIPAEGFPEDMAYENNAEYVILTKKSLYIHTKGKLTRMDDTETYVHGFCAGYFNVVYDSFKDVEATYAYLARYSTFFNDENISITRDQLQSEFDLSSKDDFRTFIRTDLNA